MISFWYDRIVSNGEHRAAIDRYLKLKAEEEARAIARMAELYQYHYLNMYDHIAKTGYHPSGRPATEWEKRIAPYVVAIPVIQDLAAAFAGRQIAKYGSSVGGYTAPLKTTSGGSRTNTTPKPVQGPPKPIASGQQRVGIVQSRINIANGPTRVSPSQNAGFNHVVARHFNSGVNAGQFTISQADLKDILQKPSTINAPVTYDSISGNYSRTIDVGYTIGTVKPSIPKVGGNPTSRIKIYTDSLGNLVTAFPME